MVINPIGLAIKELFSRKSYFLVIYRNEDNMGFFFYQTGDVGSIFTALEEIESKHNLRSITVTNMIRISKREFEQLNYYDNKKRSNNNRSKV